MKKRILLVLVLFIMVFGVTGCFSSGGKNDGGGGKDNPTDELLNFDSHELKFEDLTVVYDGNPHYIYVEGKIPAGIQVEYINNGQVEPGHYEVIAEFIDKEGKYNPIEPRVAYLYIEENIKDYNIWFNDQTFEYDGNPHSIYVEGDIPKGVEVYYEGNDQIEPGHYEVIAHFHDPRGIYHIEPMRAFLIINEKYDREIFDTNLLKFEDQIFEYDGKSHSIYVEGELPWGIEIYYSNNDQIEEGEYVVTAHIQDTIGNYDFIGPTILEARMIIRKGYTIDENEFYWETQEYIYDGNPHGIELKGPLPEGYSIEYENNYQINAGDYWVTASIMNEHNRVVATFSEMLIIRRVVLNDLITFEDKTVKYDGNAHSIVFEGELPADVDYYYEGNDKVSAGVYTVQLFFIADSTNYDYSAIMATLTIEAPYFDWSTIKFEDKTFDYNGEAHSLEIEGELPGSVEVLYEGNEKVNAGTYTVKAHLLDPTGTYTDLPVKTAKLTINKVSLNVDHLEFEQTVPYNGNSYEVKYKGTVDNNFSVQYDSYQTYILPGTYTTTVTFTNSMNDNYLPTTKTVTLNIVKDGSYHDVVFNLPNGNKQSYVVKDGERVTNVPTLEKKNGYTVSWDKDFDIITTDLEITYKYEPIVYNIYYNLAGGIQNELNKTTYTIEEDVKFYDLTHNSFGYVFNNWYVEDENKTSNYHFDYETNTILKGSFGDLYATASWSYYGIEAIDGCVFDYTDQNNPTIYYEVSSDTTYLSIINTLHIKSNDYFVYSENGDLISEDTITLNGDLNTFKIRITYGNKEVEYTFKVNRLRNVRYVFKVDEVEYSDYITVEEKTFIDTLNTTPTKEGMKFIGWTIDGETLVSFPYQILDNTEFKAKFVNAEYKIVYDLNGGDEVIDYIQTVEYGKEFKLLSPISNTLTFNGWTYNGQLFNDTIWTLEEDVVLVANWDATVTILYNDTQLLSKIVKRNEQLVIEKTINGQAITKLYFDKELQNEVPEDYKVIENVTLYASLENNLIVERGTIIGVIDTSIEEISIPRTVNDGTVNTIGNNAFSECKNLKAVYMANNITYILEDAFYGCDNLQLVQISGTPTIAQNAFRDCKKLTIIGDQSEEAYTQYITEEYIHVIGNVYELVIIEDFIYRLVNGEAYIVKYMGNEKVVELPSYITNNSVEYKVVKIYKHAFVNNDNLKILILSDTIKEIESNAIYNCEDVAVLNVDFYKDMTFENNWYDYSILYNEYLKDGDFYYEVSGDTIKVIKYVGEEDIVRIPESIQIDNVIYPISQIASNAFTDNGKLQHIIISNKINLIEKYAFENSENIAIYVDETNEYYNDWNQKWNNHNDTYYNIKTEDIKDIFSSNIRYYLNENDEVFLVDVLDKDAEELIIHDAKYVYSYAFSNNDKLVSVIFENEVYLETNAFYNCASLRFIRFNKKLSYNTNFVLECDNLDIIKVAVYDEELQRKLMGAVTLNDYVIVDGAAYVLDGNKATLIRNLENVDFIIPETIVVDDKEYNVTGIELRAFNSKIATTIKFHDKFEEIDRYIFDGNNHEIKIVYFTKYYDIYLPYGRTFTVLNNFASEDGTKIKYENYYTIYEYDEKYLIDGIYYEVVDEEAHVVLGIPYLLGENITIPAEIIINEKVYPVTTIETHALTKCESLQNNGGTLVLPNSIKTIKANAIDIRSSKQCSVYIPGSVETIERYGIYAQGKLYVDLYEKPETWDENWTDPYYQNYYVTWKEQIVVKDYDIQLDDFKYNLVEEVYDETTYYRAHVVEYCGNEEFLTVPQTVTYEDQVYYVSRLLDDALAGKGIKSLRLYSTITSIGNNSTHVDGKVYAESTITYDTNVHTNIDIDSIIIYNGFEFIIESDYAIILSCLSKPEKLVIPTSIIYNNESYLVEEVASGAFRGSTAKIIIIPESVKTIRQYAFAQLSGNEIVYISKGVSTIENYSIYSVSSYQTIICCEGVAQSGWETNWKKNNQTYNYGCNVYYGVENYHYENDSYFAITSEGAILIDYMGGNEYEIPSTITYNKEDYSVIGIGNRAFYNTKIEKLYIPDSVVKFASDAFLNTSSLKEVYIDNASNWAIKEFGNEYSSPIYSNSVKLFENDYLVEDLIIEEGVTEISNYAFRNYKYLTSVSIPSTMQVFDDQTFAGCSSLNKVNIESLAIWTQIDFKTEQANPLYYAKNLYIDGINAETLYLEGSFETIKKYAFVNVTNVKNVVIGYQINTIETDAFKGCINIENVYAESLISWMNIGFANGQSNPLNYAKQLYVENSLIEDLIIPETITEIKAYAFYGYNGLKSVTFHSDIINVSASAFENCINLEKVNASSIEDWMNIVFANEYANPLYYAKNLYVNNELIVDLVIPENITRVNAYTFINCTSIESVKFYGNMNIIEYDIFIGCDNLSKIHVDNISVWMHMPFQKAEYNPMKYAKQLYVNNELLVDVVIPAEETTIGNYVFSYCESIKSVTIPSTVTVIGVDPFNNCKNIIIYCEAEAMGYDWSSYWNNNYFPVIWDYKNSEFVEIDGFKYILNDTTASLIEYNGDQLWITVPSEITVGSKTYVVDTICDQAFANSSDAIAIDLPNTIKTIGRRILGYQSAVDHILVPESVENIAAYAFTIQQPISIYVVAKAQNLNWELNWNHLNYVYYDINAHLCDVGGQRYYFNDTAKLVEYNAIDPYYNIPDMVMGNTVPVTQIEDYAMYSSQVEVLYLGSNISHLGQKFVKDTVHIITSHDSSHSVWSGMDTSRIHFGVTRDQVAIINDCYYVLNGSEATFIYYGGEETEVTIPQTIIHNEVEYTVSYIGSYAFENSNIQKVIIPDTIININSNAFINCEELKYVLLSSNVKQLFSNSFNNCENITILLSGEVNTSWGSKWNNEKEYYTNIDFALFKELTSDEDFIYYETINDELVVLKYINTNKSHLYIRGVGFKDVVKINANAIVNDGTIKSIRFNDTITTVMKNAVSTQTELNIYFEVETIPSGWDSNWYNKSYYQNYYYSMYYNVDEVVVVKDKQEYILIGEEVTLTRFVSDTNEARLPRTVIIGGVDYEVHHVGKFALKDNNLETIYVPRNYQTIDNYAYAYVNGTGNTYRNYVYKKLNCEIYEYNSHMPDASLDSFNRYKVENVDDVLEYGKTEVFKYYVDNNKKAHITSFMSGGDVLVLDYINGYEIVSIDYVYGTKDYMFNKIIVGPFIERLEASTGLNAKVIELNENIKYIGDSAIYDVDYIIQRGDFEFENSIVYPYNHNVQVFSASDKDYSDAFSPGTRFYKMDNSNVIEDIILREDCSYYIRNDNKIYILECNALGLLDLSKFSGYEVFGVSNVTADTVYIPSDIEVVDFVDANVIYFESSAIKPNWKIEDYNARPMCYYNVDINNIVIQDDIEYVIINNEATVVRSLVEKENVVIPEYISNNGVSYPVTRIGNYAFSLNYSLKEVSIANNVVEIGKLAFSDTGLTEIKLPENLKTIGIGAFVSCGKLSKVEFNDQLETISEGAFEYCISLQTIEIPNNVKEVGERAFDYCLNLEKVILSENLETIGKAAFYDCPKLREITLPESVKYVGEEAFSLDILNVVSIADYCRFTFDSFGRPFGDPQLYIDGKKVTDLVIPGTVKEIPAKAFIFMDFETLVIEEGVEKIGDGAFLYVPLKSIQLPDTLTNPNYEIFSLEHCTSLYLPKNITKFIYNSYMEKIVIYTPLREGEVQFEGTSYLQNEVVYYNVNRNDIIRLDDCEYLLKGSTATLITYFGTAQEYTIAKEITYNGNTYSVTNVSSYAFVHNTNVTDIYVHSGINKDEFDSINTAARCFYEGYYRVNTHGKYYNYLEQVEEIDGIKYALFNDKLYVIAVTADKAEITIPAQVNFKGTTTDVIGIAKNAFYKLNNLERIFVSSTTTEAPQTVINESGNPVFYFEGDVSNYNHNRSAFLNQVVYNYKDTINVTIDEFIYSFSEGNAKVIKYDGEDSTVVIPEAVNYNGITYPITEVAKNALLYTKNPIKKVYIKAQIEVLENICSEDTLEYIELPSSLKEIRGYAFTSENLKYIDIPYGVEKIDEYAFENGGAKYVSIPSTVTSIGYSSARFTAYITNENNTSSYNLYNVNYVTLDEAIKLNSVDDIIYGLRADSAFVLGYCGKDEEVVIPSTITLGEKSYPVTLIGGNSFSMTNIRKVTISQGIKEIGDYAFAECSNLEEVIIEDGVETIGEYAFYLTYMKNITLPSTLKEIKANAFNSAQLEYVEIPSSVETIGEYAFSRAKVRDVKLNEGLLKIEKYAFYSCEYLETINFPNTLTEIGNAAFSYTQLSKVYLSQNVQKLDSYSFEKEVVVFTEHASKPSGWSNSGLYTIVFNYNQENFVEIDGNIWIKFDDLHIVKLLHYLSEEETFIIPETYIINDVEYTVNSILPYAFENSNIKYVFIGENVGVSSLSCIDSNDGIVIKESRTYSYNNMDGTIIENIPVQVDDIKEIRSNEFYDYAILHSNEVVIMDIKNHNNNLLIIDNIDGINVTQVLTSAFRGLYDIKSIYLGGLIENVSLKKLPYYQDRVIYTGYNNTIINDNVYPVHKKLNAADVIVTEELEFVVMNDNTAAVTKVKSNKDEIIIPSEIKVNDVTYTVTTIKSYAYNRYMTKGYIYIPETIKIIESNSFTKTVNLLIGSNYEDMIIQPNSYVNGGVVFESKLENIITIDSFKYILVGNEAKLIEYMGNENNVIIPSIIEHNGNKYIVDTILSFAFKDSGMIREVQINEMVTDIYGKAFENNHFILSTLTVKGVNWIEGWNSDNVVLWGVSGKVVYDENFKYLINENNEAIILGCITDSELIKVPSTIVVEEKEYNVIRIFKNAFKNITTDKYVMIPNTILYIDKDAFSKCYNLSVLLQAQYIPSTWHQLWSKEVGFVIRNVNIDEIREVKTNNEFMYYINNDNKVVILKSLLSSDAIYEMRKLTIDVVDGYEVYGIQDFAFDYYTSDISLYISDSVEFIGERAFGYAVLYFETNEYGSNWHWQCYNKYYQVTWGYTLQ